MSQLRGRFKKAASEIAARYSASISFDCRLYPYDIAGSIAHARMLGKQGIIPQKDAEAIIDGLNSIYDEIEQGQFQFKPELEDIHMNIEARLIEKIGDIGGRLHTARSRNDQVALDVRLFAKDAICHTLDAIRELQKAIVPLAERNIKVIMPGFTHMQHAQPVLLAHHLLAYFEMLQRDISRFEDCMLRMDIMPLGSGALAGVSYDIDRESVAKELGFNAVTRNSIDAVSDRDFVVDYESAAGICMMHLSRLSEELVLWSSQEFDFIELDDSFTTSSSILPQKKNPDMAELARSKTGRVYGHLMAMLTTLKGLPLAYDRDLQEDKEGLFDTVDTLLSTLEVAAGMVGTVRVKPDNTLKAASQGYTLAIDLADYLVKKGEPFRGAHAAVAKLVSYAVDKGKSLDALKLAEYKKFSALFEKDVLSITVESSIADRDNIGGTAAKRVKRELSRAKKLVESFDIDD